MVTLHLVCQETDEVDSSHIASAIMDHLENIGNRPPSELNVASEPIGSSDSMDKNDCLIQKIKQISTDQSFAIIHSKASVFDRLLDQLSDSDEVREYLEFCGIALVLHLPLLGGRASGETLLRLESILSQLNDSVVIWLNVSHEKFVNNRDEFREMAIYRNYKNKILGVVDMHRYVGIASDSATEKASQKQLDATEEIQAQLKHIAFNNGISHFL